MSERRVEAVLGPLLRLARRRLLLVSTWDHLCRWGVPVLGLLTVVGMVAVRDLGVSGWWCLSLASLVPLAATILARRSLPTPRALLRHIDASIRSDDLLGAAYEFAAQVDANDPPPPTFESAAKSCILRRATLRASQVSLPSVLPLRRYRLRSADVAIVCTLAAAVVFPPLSHQRDENAAPDLPANPTPSTTAQEPETRDRVAPLRRELTNLRAREDEVGAIATAVDRLLETINSDDAHVERALADLDRLAAVLDELQRTSGEAAELDPGLLEVGLREIAERLRTLDEGREVARDLGELDPEGVARGISRALRPPPADPGEQENATDMERRERLLRRIREALDRAIHRETTTPEKLQTLERRLSRASERGDPRDDPRSPEAQESRDELERLHRKQRAEDGARARLRALRDAARRLGREDNAARSSPRPSPASAKNSPSVTGGPRSRDEQLLVTGLSNAVERVSKSQRMARTRAIIDEAKRTLRRIAKDGARSVSMKAHADAFARAAKGQAGPEGRGKTAMSVGDASDVTAAATSAPPRDALRPRGDGGTGDASGDGAGDASSTASVQPRDTGAVARDADGLPSQRGAPLTGARGPGTSRAVTIHDATQRGFANTPYDDVFTDYRGFAQSALDDETLPAAQRDAARRYFRLIQPRK